MGRSYGGKAIATLTILACIWFLGCRSMAPLPADLPNEKAKMALPPYVIEPPDVLQVNAVQLVPKPPYKIKPLDILLVQFPASPLSLSADQRKDLMDAGYFLSANYTVEPEGTLNLGPAFGKVQVTDMTIDEAKKVVEARIRQLALKEVVDIGKVTVTLAQSRGMQQVLGPHLVRPDGTIGLGTYGQVFVTGLTLDQARMAIEEYLSEFILKPEISLDVAGFNSKVYYIIFDGGGAGEQVIRVPSTGNETVLDAIAQVSGLSSVASRQRIWIARPGPADSQDEQTIPVDWKAITRGGKPQTNYQVFPGDRIYVQAKPLVTVDTYLNMVFTPLQRIMGSTVFGVGTYNSLLFAGRQGSIGSPGFGGGGTGSPGIVTGR